MMSKNLIAFTCLVLVVALGFMSGQAEAGQGCPFDDGSCQEYCNQQGCNMGYCGHFAWIQCICRKCGDEWSWYDKVRYNPDKTVNQTELDSLKLNGTATLILTNGQQQQIAAPATKVNNVTSKQPETAQRQQAATLTTLLIPDLSDTSGKLDLNDIPDENSDKFLDYLAKNHEKLVEATSAKQQQQQQQQQQQHQDSDLGDDDEQQQQQQGSTTTTITTMSQDERDDEIIEIQISSSNNNTSNEPAPTTSVPQQQPTSTTTTTTTTTTDQTTIKTTPLSPETKQPPSSSSPVARLLRMAVVERASDEID